MDETVSFGDDGSSQYFFGQDVDASTEYTNIPGYESSWYLPKPRGLLPFGAYWKLAFPNVRGRPPVAWKVCPVDASKLPPITEAMVQPADLQQILSGMREAISRKLIPANSLVQFHPQFYWWSFELGRGVDLDTVLHNDPYGNTGWKVRRTATGQAFADLVTADAAGFAKFANFLTITFASIAFGGAWLAPESETTGAATVGTEAGTEVTVTEFDAAPVELGINAPDIAPESFNLIETGGAPSLSQITLADLIPQDLANALPSKVTTTTLGSAVETGLTGLAEKIYQGTGPGGPKPPLNTNTQRTGMPTVADKLGLVFSPVYLVAGFILLCVGLFALHGRR